MPHYERFLSQVREIVQPILDSPPPNLFGGGSLKQKIRTINQVREIAGKIVKNRNALVPLYELFCSPASHILDRWFESDIVKATLATDAVIRAMVSPTQATSAYVLLHHVMGESAGHQGVWSYVEGGMGSISNAIAQSALSYGAQILTNAPVKKILYDSNQTVYGVELDDGTKLTAKIIVSNTTPYHTFLELLPGYQVLQKNSNDLPFDFAKHIRFADYSCGAFKINCAIDRLPNHTCCPNKTSDPEPQHIGTAHFETKLEDIENA
jgi:phytoene dehydrogenase-like protein